VKKTKACPAGTHLKGGRCVKEPAHACPKGTVKKGGRCVPVKACPAGTKLVKGKCVRTHTGTIQQVKPPRKQSSSGGKRKHRR